MIADFLAWLRDVALPFWSVQGYDPVRGRFHERLGWSGAPLSVPHRAMVQARQIYTFAHAARLGWIDGADLARSAMRGLRRHWCEDDGAVVRIAFSIDPATGAVLASHQDAYTYAFVLFSAAHLYQLEPDPDLLAFAGRVADFLGRELADPVQGGVFDAAPSRPQGKKQNPHMHLLEAWLAWDAAAPGHGYRERAAALVALFRDKMLSNSSRVLSERFSSEWRPEGDPDALVFEPGHHLEWAWLLLQADLATGDNHAALRRELHASALRHGTAANGLLVDEAAVTGVVKGSHRLWPHTEAIKAAAAANLDGDQAGLPLAQRMAAALMAEFLGRPFAGGWTDQLDANRRATVDYVPASSLYHLMLAAAEAHRAFVAPRDAAANGGDRP